MKGEFTGQVVLHEDGDPGVITDDVGSGWDVVFCSGYKGHFPLPTSVNEDFPFVYRPSRMESSGGQSIRPEAIEERLGRLTEIVALVDAGKAHLCIQFWERGCQGWLEKAGLDAIVAAREWIRDQETRGQLKAKILDLLEDFDAASAQTLYEQSCSQWWPRGEFQPLLDRARFGRSFIDAYTDGTLEEIDRIYNEMPVHSDNPSRIEIALLKQPKVESRLARLELLLDSDQRLAIGRPDRRLLVKARAGSGKTRTLAALAAIVISDVGLDPNQVLTLAFNKKAADEIGSRIRTVARAENYKNARTFHSLAHRLAGYTGRNLIFDDGALQPSRRNQSRFIERVIHRILNPAFKERLYEFFRKELEQVERIGSDLPESEYFDFRRSMTDFTLGGENVKSNGEKFIADFLFEHGIPYVYEKVYSWAGSDRIDGSPYRPDFSISFGGRDVILEHWAIDPCDPTDTVPAWWKDEGGVDYRRQIEEKRDFWASRGVLLLETHTGMLRRGREEFERHLSRMLSEVGVICKKLDRVALVQRVAEAPRTISRISDLFLSFISRAKKRGWTVEDVTTLASEDPDPEPRNRIFNELAIRAFGEYEALLESESAMDFDDLLMAAAERVRRDGPTTSIELSRRDSIQLGDIKVILLDEFQDFSELYARLLNSIIAMNPEVRIVAVGDDWQAINGFAGAQLKFFSSFEKYFPGGGVTAITSNYRSGRVIVGAGNAIMSGNGKGAAASSRQSGVIERRNVDQQWVSGTDEVDQLFLEAAKRTRQGSAAFFLAKALKACAQFICESIYTQNGKKWLPAILLISRTGYAYGETLTDFEKILRGVLQRHPEIRDVSNEVELEVLTAHRSKGKEADTVIVLEATARQFPKVHADNQLFGLFGVKAEDSLAEERRLFYVAVTRAEHRLLLLSETDKESPFINALGIDRGTRHLEALATGDTSHPRIVSEFGRKLQKRIASLGPVY